MQSPVKCLLVAMLTICAVTAFSQPAHSEMNLRKFFCMNAIAPYHEGRAPDEATRDNVWNSLDQRLKLAKELGISSVRIDLWWDAIQPEKNRFSWEFTDKVMESFRSDAMEPYPIFCYSAAWAKGVSPATEEERKLYSEYAARTVARYHGQVRYWEVWNEPNIIPFWKPTPDAVLYGKLLKQTYTAIKAKQPDALVVGMCTSGPDYKFIENAYRAGGRGSLDALSFHHYDSKPDESQLETEIRTIRRIMERYGDGEKPMFISEMGYSTGPSEVVKPSTYDEQAEWIVKCHLLSIAEGVQRFYYFKMIDDPAGYKPDGMWGLFESDLSHKKSWQSYMAMAERIAGAKYLGRAYRCAVEFERRDDAEVQLYQFGDEIAGVAWVRKSGAPMRIAFNQESTVTIENLFGETMYQVMPNALHRVIVPITHEPVYIRHLETQNAMMAGVRFEPANVYLVPGESRIVKMIITNTTDAPMNVSTAPLKYARKNFPVTIATQDDSVIVPAGQTLTDEVTLTRGTDPQPFAPQEITFNDNGKYSYRIGVHSSKAFSITMSGRVQGDALTLYAEYQNQTLGSISGSFEWRGVGDSVLSTEPISNLGSGLDSTSQVAVSVTPGDSRISLVAKHGELPGEHKSIRLWGQPMVLSALKIDGDLSDWAAVPFVRIDDPLSQMSIDHPNQSEAAICWQPDALFVSAHVEDATPLQNKEAGTNLWRGDSVELYLGFDGPTARTHYDAKQFQIGIQPGNNGSGGFLWNWKPVTTGDKKPPVDGLKMEGASVVAVKTATGYDLEARIPLSTLGQEVHDLQYLGFSMHINDSEQGGNSPHATTGTWNGSNANYRDPSGWGIAQILPLSNPPAEKTTP